MVLMLNAWLGHLIGDFLLQPGWMVVAKRRGLPGLLTHAFVIMVCTALVLAADLRLAYGVVLLAGAAHLCIEVGTITARERLRLSGAAVFLLDQVLHVASLALVVALVGPGISREVTRTFAFDLTPTQIAVADGVLFVTVLGSILVFEVGHAVGTERRVVLPYDMPRFLGMAERAASLVVAVVVHPAAALVPFVPRAVGAAVGSDDARRRHAVDLASGVTLCALAYSFIIVVGALSG